MVSMILLFQLIFLFQLFFHYNVIIVVNPFFKHISEEYWIWFSSEYSPVNNENLILAVSYVTKWLFISVFLIQYIRIISTSEYRKMLCIKRIVLFTCIACLIYIISFVIFKYFAVHYRLYMTFVSAEILSILLLYFITILRKNGNN